MSTQYYIDMHVHLEGDYEGPVYTVAEANALLGELLSSASGGLLDAAVEKVLLTIPPLARANARAYDIDPAVLDEIANEAGSMVAGIVAGGREVNVILQDYDAAMRGVAPEDAQTLGGLLSEEQSRQITVHRLSTGFGVALDNLLALSSLKAIGEIALLHLSADNDQNPFMQVDSGSDLMLQLLDFCADNALPLDIHMEILPCDVATADIERLPGDAGTLYDVEEGPNRNPRALARNIESFEAFMASARAAGSGGQGCKVILEHIGQAMILRDWLFDLGNIDPVDGQTPIDEDWLPAWLDRMLAAYPDHLFLALKWNETDPFAMWSLFANGTISYGTGQSWTALPWANRELRTSWKNLFSEYEANFVMGSDHFLSPTGEASDEGDMAATMELLETIQRRVGIAASVFGRDNAIALYGL